MLISVPLAMIAASRKDGARDHAVRVVPLIGLGMPQFWLAFLLIYAFAIKLHFFPVSGWGRLLRPPAVDVPAQPDRGARALACGHPQPARQHAQRARRRVRHHRQVQGDRGKRLFLRHVLRNAVIPAVTVLGINIGFLIGGTVIIENVFAIPGLGQLMINSIFQRDFTVVQGITLVFAIMVILLNLAADVAYAALDPRVRFSR